MTRLALRLMAMLTPRADREALIGDVVEECARIEQGDGRTAARRWLYGQLCRALWHAVLRLAAAPGARVTHAASGAMPRAVAAILRDAVRGLRNAPGATALAFGLLTMAMTAATVTFSIVDGLSLRRIPFGAPDRLVGISFRGQPSGPGIPLLPLEYLPLRDGLTTISAIGAARISPPVRLEGDGLVDEVTSARVTTELFDLLGVRPAAGRFFAHETDDAVVLSYAFWSRTFGRDPAVVGRRLTIGGATREIVGILPEDTSYPITAETPQVYLPLTVERENPRARTLFAVGRLRDDATVEEARAEIQRLVPRAVVTSLPEQLTGAVSGWLRVAFAAVGLVLLVACANVANLLLARAATRARELAVRETLGASRARLAAGLLVEGLILALASSAAASLFSVWGLRIAVSSLPGSVLSPWVLSRLASISIDGHVLAAAVAAAMACGLVFGSAPAWLAARSDPGALIKASGGPLVGGRRLARALSAILVADVAFVSSLLVSTTLVVTSFVLVTTVDLGFERRNVVTIGFSKPLNGSDDTNAVAATAVLHRELIDRATAVPGVLDAAIATNAGPPLTQGSVKYSLDIPGIGDTGLNDMLEMRFVTSGYVETLGMRVVSGRPLLPSDRAGAPLVMLIDEVAAKRYFPGRDPVGQIVGFRGPTTIVGVVSAIHYGGPEAAAPPAMFVPAEQELPRYQRSPASGSLSVRTSGDPRALAETIRAAIWPVLTGGELGPPHYIDDDFLRLTAGRRFNAAVMAALGFVAVIIGAMGVYATMAFLVTRQVPVIGLRLALGATPGGVMRAVLRETLLRIAIGAAIGLAGAWAFSSLLGSLLFGVRPTEPRVYLGVALVLVVVGLAAAMLPARRAARLDPLQALRAD